MSSLPSHPPAHPPSFPVQPLSIGVANPSVGPGMDNSILSLAHTPDLPVPGSFSIESNAQVIFTSNSSLFVCMYTVNVYKVCVQGD